MAGEIALAAYMSLGIGTALAFGFSLPKLTEEASSQAATQEEVEMIQNEVSHCKKTMPGVDCACFAGKSGHVMANERLAIRRFAYTDKTTLARNQAQSKC